MSSLSKRLLSALVVIPCIVAATLGLPTPYFAALMGVLAMAGAWEWAVLAKWSAWPQRTAYVVVFGAVLLATSAALSSPQGAMLMLCGAVSWWIVAAYWVICFQRGASLASLEQPWVRVVVGWLFLAPTWGALVYLHGWQDRYLVLTLLVLIWVADSVAYFVGRRWGVTRIAPRVSPGKTVEGALGGIAAVAALAVAVAALGYASSPVFFVLLCLATVLVSVVGDLAESLFKRKAGVKDSGGVMPGHGGVLDRIDSLTAAAPFFALGLHLARYLA